MKSVLLTTAPEAYLCKGDAEYEILEIALNLRKLGVIADVFGPYSRDILHYDTVMHFSLSASGLPIVREARKRGREIILWPALDLRGGPSASGPEAAAAMDEFIDLSELLVFKSQAERRLFESMASLNGRRALIIPAGVDPCFAEPTPDGLFRQSFELDEYILWMGSMQPPNNPLGVIEALRDLRTPLVWVGQSCDEACYAACRTQAPAHFLFLGPMEYKSDLMRAAIRESRLYLDLGLEPTGKAALEAAICGTRVLVSDLPWEREHLGGFATYADPGDLSSIRAGVHEAMQASADAEQPSVLAQKYLLPDVLTGLKAFLGAAS